MSKQGTPHDSKKPAEGHAPKGAPAPGTSPHSHQQASAPSKGAGNKVGCNADGCKSKDVRASFCEEHFRQYKFGLITKAGEKVLDYDKKIEHYQNWLRAQKVA